MKRNKEMYLEFPAEYLELDHINRETICLTMIEQLVKMIENNFPKNANKIDIMNNLLDKSIEINVENEFYEVAQVMKDIKDLINEQTY